jgi:hypothetical protein
MMRRDASDAMPAAMNLAWPPYLPSCPNDGPREAAKSPEMSIDDAVKGELELRLQLRRRLHTGTRLR